MGGRLFKTGKDRDWIQVSLPWGDTGWLEKEHFSEFPPFSRDNLVDFAFEFLGYPFFWGGRSPKGFDCSGFVQFTFDMLGVTVPRDSWMQQKESKSVAVLPSDAGAGDLLFFGESSNKADHVGISLGGGRIIHARGRVRINSLNPREFDFDSQLRKSFIEVKTFF